MERTALAQSRVQPPPRAARKCEWLRSALAHHHCPDLGADNEIVVLATGIDQYLQEVFHHLVFSNKHDTMPAEDFITLCSVLGLPGVERGKRKMKEVKGDETEYEEDEEFVGVCSGLPDQLSFKDFHSRLCGYFRVRSARKGTGACAWRLPVTEDTELVERQIRLRWPRARRRKCVSFDLTRDQKGPTNTPNARQTTEDRESDEVAALRELVEDLRSALQGSDARCLALEVALRQERSHSSLPNPHSFAVSTQPTTSITFSKGKVVPTHRIRGQCSSTIGEGVKKVARRRDISDPLQRELKLIRSSRDGQLKEAIKFNERLEEELRWAYQEVHKLHMVESALRKENTIIRRRAEEAREALRLGLERVRLIQEQAQSVPELQSRISQLEAALQQHRSRCTCTLDVSHRQFTGAEDSCRQTDVECLQRAVEGRAASDDEEDGRGSRLEVKKNVSQLHSCGKGCQNHVVHQLPAQNHYGKRGCCSCKGQKQEQPGGSKVFEKEKRPEDDKDTMRPEEKDKTRLSLLEEKLTDALTLLLQLRNKNVSRRTLETIVMDTLDVCSRSGDDPSQVLQIADALCARLSSRDLLGNSGDDERGDGGEKVLDSSSCCANSLLISC